ncbi:MAG: lysophospholipase [Desulfovibrionaceae bacterium]|nr:lysophospholipase [Desulfovibrionaceae bacterium]
MKKLLTLLLCAAMLPTALALPASAASPQAKYTNPNGCTPKRLCRHSPVIILPGIGQAEARVKDANGETIARFSDMPEDGKRGFLDVHVPAHGILEILGEDHLYLFNYAQMGNVWENVDLLAEFIDMVRKQTGHSKVSLCAISLGGTLATGYLDRYGHKKLDQLMNVVATTDGSQVLGDLTTGNLRKDAAFWRNGGLTELLDTMKDRPGYARSIGFLLELLMRFLPAPVASWLIRLPWPALMFVLMQTVGGTQFFWALVPRERYPAAREQLLKGPLKAELRKETDSFYQAQCNLHKNILAAVKDGVIVNNIAGSGFGAGEGDTRGDYTYMQLFETKMNSDGVIHVEGATMGATCALPGKKLPAGYVPRSKGYLSPDGSIDCSTALLPDNTWVFLGQPHEVGRNDALINLMTALFANRGMNVKTNPKKYPQYNYAMDTESLRRGNIRDAQALLADPAKKLSAADKKALQAAINEAVAVRALTIGNAKRADAVQKALVGLLQKYDMPFRENKPPEHESAGFEAFLGDAMAFLGHGAWLLWGDGSYIEFWKLFGFFGRLSP